MRFEDRDLAPCQGSEPFIFLSYSHKDAAEAEDILRELNRMGYRVWYDEGLVPGAEMDEHIAERVASCSYFFALISKAYLQSEYCKDELRYARDQERPSLLLYLEDVQLPRGMDMRFGRLLAIQKFAYSRDTFFKKLFSTEGLERCRRETETVPPEPAPPPAPAPVPSRRRGLAVGCLALALLLGLGLWRLLLRSEPVLPAETEPPSPSAAKIQEAAQALAALPEPTPEPTALPDPSPEPSAAEQDSVPHAPAPSFQQAANRQAVKAPTEEERFDNDIVLYVDAPKGHSIQAFNKWDSGNKVIGYAYHGSRVHIAAEHGSSFCILYYTENNELDAAWVSAGHVTEDYPGRVFRIGDPDGAEGGVNCGDFIGSWSKNSFDGTSTRYTVLDSPVKNCVGFTLDYQLIGKSEDESDVLGPRRLFVNDGNGWIEVGSFDYDALGPCHVEVVLDRPTDLVAVATVADVRRPNGFSFRQSLLDVLVGETAG